jgi:hypothetical protein
MQKYDGTKDNSDLVQITQGYIQEAKFARQNRMDQNQRNFECYHMRQDYSHKLPGQSKEFVGKQAMAVEQITSFIQQGLVDAGEWFGMELQGGVRKEDCPISADEAKQLLMRDLESCDFISTIGDSVKLGLLQSLMVAKPHGHMKDRAIFYAETKENADGTYKDVLKRLTKPYWSPKVDVLRAEDFYPDPTGRGLYFIQEAYVDFHDIKKLTEGPDAIYSASVLDEIEAGYTESDNTAAKKSNETGQSPTYSYQRKRIKLYECWGTIVDSLGKVLHEDVTWTIADDTLLLRKPTPNPFWHSQIPFIFAPFIRVPNSVWHKALMDGPTRANMALNELYNLMVDDGMNSVHGIKQIRTDWLEDESQISNGVYPGITLKVNSSAPVGAKVIEVVPTNGMSAETMNVYQMMNSEFSAMALTNDLRMGVMPNRAVKATEVVEASQSITGVMTGISKVIEVNFVEPILYQMWANRLQHLDETYRPDLAAIIGEDRADEVLAMSREERFAKCVDGFKFKVFGVSRVLAKQKDFRKITALLQTLSADPPLMEEFLKEYSMGSLLGEFLRSLDISVDRIKLSRDEKAGMQAQAESAMMAQGQGMQAGQGPDMQSQIPQASAEGSAESTESMIPRSDMSGLAGKAQGGIN